MRERATVDRLDVKRPARGIRDTAEQDTPIEQNMLRHYRPWLVATILILAAAAVTIPALSMWLETDRSALRSQLRFSTVSRQTFVRDVSAQGIVVAAVLVRHCMHRVAALSPCKSTPAIG